MEEEKRVSREAYEEPAKTDAEAESAAPEEPTAFAAGQDTEALNAEIRDLKAQNEEFSDRTLRLVAEMENLRRRTERDKSEFAKYAISEFARDMLTVGDNIRRAIEAVPKEAVISHPALASLIEGVEVTERDLLKVLERFQVKRFDPTGEQFNPHLHEAMTKVDAPNVPAETVVQVLHAGYMIGERVLRPAAVIVAKGGTTEQTPRTGGGEGDDTLPPGAMRVPDDAVSSSSPQGEPDDAHFRSRMGGVNAGEAPRTGGTEGQGASADERVAPFRRSRQSGSPLNGPRQNSASPQPKPSTLHKPVIGSKQEW